MTSREELEDGYYVGNKTTILKGGHIDALKKLGQLPEEERFRGSEGKYPEQITLLGQIYQLSGSQQGFGDATYVLGDRKQQTNEYPEYIEVNSLGYVIGAFNIKGDSWDFPHKKDK